MGKQEYCVTGGTGFIAAYLIKSLLQHGHTVRATVRDPGDEDKVGFLWELEGAKERLKLVKADLLVPESFDDAVRGVDGVFHTASPVLVPYDDNIQESLIDPCIKGTLNVLRSCSKSQTVKRVVLTSSCSSIRYRFDAQAASPLDESNWTDLDYCKRGLRGELPNTALGFVHIDDVVAAHVLAMEDTRASGRLVVSGSVAHWSEVIDMLRPKYPDYPYESKLSAQKGDSNPHSMDTSKIAQLGFPPFKTLEQMFDDCIISFQQKGLL
ncbi:unnamed protein product [Linum tenue]|uniref:NAD-dependent epimerase/dehydratase domain-containing protein n=1 Tax=Linum tenue TaxID=586396 RepID=A0AAV0NB49_9ROSI|nr:unnamed protein product [Linum tenue]